MAATSAGYLNAAHRIKTGRSGPMVEPMGYGFSLGAICAIGLWSVFSPYHKDLPLPPLGFVCLVKTP
jgi:hypothetical protein